MGRRFTQCSVVTASVWSVVSPTAGLAEARLPQHDGYTQVSISDLSTSARYPFGSYAEFFESASRPARISFTFETKDAECTITDALGETFRVTSGEKSSFSRLYFPFQVWDEQDKNACDNMSFTHVFLEVDRLSSYQNVFAEKIRQTSPFQNVIFADLKGASVIFNAHADFYRNFEDPRCLRVTFTDGQGQTFAVTPDQPALSGVEAVLPLKMVYAPVCLTSPLVEDAKEDREKDVSVGLSMVLSAPQTGR